MDLNWFESLIYGLISGVTEFLPISSQAHQRLMLQLFGVDISDPVRDLFIHIALLFSLYSGCRTLFDQVKRDRRIQQRKRSNTYRYSHIALDMRLVKSASAPMLLAMVALYYFRAKDVSLLTLALFLLINGIILFAPDRMLQSNKDVRSMSVMDSILIGFSGALSVFPGVSRMGTIISSSVARGADKQHALNWGFLLSVPAIILFIGIDLFTIFTFQVDINFWSNFFSYILSAAFSYLGGYISIRGLKLLVSNMGISGFCYYSWGAALFTFIIYLTAV